MTFLMPWFMQLRLVWQCRKNDHKVVPHWKDAGVPMVGIGIGIDCGLCYVGNVGSSSLSLQLMGTRFRWLSVGNLARPGQVLITDQYYKKVAGKVPKPYKQLKNILLKGLGPNSSIHVLKGLDYPDYTSKS